MIIRARTKEGVKAKVFNADGTRCHLLIFYFDTETKEALYYESEVVDGKRNRKMTPFEYNGISGRLERKPIIKSEVLDLYVEIDGMRV